MHYVMGNVDHSYSIRTVALLFFTLEFEHTPVRNDFAIAKEQQNGVYSVGFCSNCFRFCRILLDLTPDSAGFYWILLDSVGF